MSPSIPRFPSQFSDNKFSQLIVKFPRKKCFSWQQNSDVTTCIRIYNSRVKFPSPWKIPSCNGAIHHFFYIKNAFFYRTWVSRGHLQRDVVRQSVKKTIGVLKSRFRVLLRCLKLKRFLTLKLIYVSVSVFFSYRAI